MNVRICHGWRSEKDTHSATLGAMTLQGPHQVAKASRTTTLLFLMAASNSVLLFRVSIFSETIR